MKTTRRQAMNISKAVENQVMRMPSGQVFGYGELPDYAKSSTAVIKAIGRMVKDQKLERVSKGKFYVPKQGLMGKRRPSDNELIRSVLYKDGRLRGYVTGLALYNKLGLTTQVPRTVTVACNGSRITKEFGTIQIRTVVTAVPVKEQDVKLLQFLDVLKEIKKIPDSDINLTLTIMRRNLSELQAKQLSRFVSLAKQYYSAQTKALVGLLVADFNPELKAIKELALNPTTIYKLDLDKNKWPQAKQWNIQ